MRYSKLTKALTLLFFVGMVISFLLYRTGTFDKRISKHVIQESPNGSVVNARSADTSIVPKKDSFRRKPRMSSSKTLVVIDDLYIPPKESDSAKFKKMLQDLQKEQWRKSINDPVKQNKQLISSSKSGAVFTPDSKLFDSLFKAHFNLDTTGKDKKKKAKQ